MKKNILIVDDDQDFIDLYTEFLSSEFNIFSVKSLKDCLHFLKENPYKIDLILCDIFMPDADGFEVCDYLNSKKEYSFYPILFKTSSLNENVISRCILEKERELISSLMTNHEIVIRIKKELKKSNLVKIYREERLQLLIDKKNGNVIYPNEIFQLYFTDNEVEILKVLSESNSPIERDELAKKVFGENFLISDNNLNTVFSGIRKKVSHFKLSIKSIRGQGVTLCNL